MISSFTTRVNVPDNIINIQYYDDDDISPIVPSQHRCLLNLLLAVAS